MPVANITKAHLTSGVMKDPEYVRIACRMYESLCRNYLAIADDLARRENLPLPSGQTSLIPGHCDLEAERALEEVQAQINSLNALFSW